MNFPDQYHAAAVWQTHLMDERNQRRLAELVARRQRQRPRRGLRDLVRMLRLRRPAPAPAVRTRAVGCVV